MVKVEEAENLKSRQTFNVLIFMGVKSNRTKSGNYVGRKGDRFFYHNGKAVVREMSKREWEYVSQFVHVRVFEEVELPTWKLYFEDREQNIFPKDETRSRNGGDYGFGTKFRIFQNIQKENEFLYLENIWTTAEFDFCERQGKFCTTQSVEILNAVDKNGLPFYINAERGYEDENENVLESFGNYITKFDLRAGTHIEHVFNDLQKRNELCFTDHNDRICVSTMSENKIFQILSGYDKDTYYQIENAARAERLETQQKLEEERKKNIPFLIEKYTERAKKIVEMQFLEKFIEIIPVRVNDLYNGMEIGASLEIIKSLNEGMYFNEVKTIMENQNHSGASWGLVMRILIAFCKRGRLFYAFCKDMPKIVLFANGTWKECKTLVQAVEFAADPANDPTGRGIKPDSWISYEEGVILRDEIGNEIIPAFYVDREKTDFVYP